MAMDPYKVFRRPLLTEKTTIQKVKYLDRPNAPDIVKYTFEVDVKATKMDIRGALEFLFPETQGNILKINTLRKGGKTRDPDKNRRYRRYRQGRTISQKKAIVTLREGVTIQQFEGV